MDVLEHKLKVTYLWLGERGQVRALEKLYCLSSRINDGSGGECLMHER